MAEAGLRTKQPFNQAANDSPRSGSSKRVTPLLWAAAVIAIITLTVWFAVGL